MQQQQQQQSVLPALQTTAVAAPVYCADLDEPDDINVSILELRRHEKTMTAFTRYKHTREKREIEISKAVKRKLSF